MLKEFKIGLIGCGTTGGKRLNAIASTGLGKIVRVSDSSENRAKEFACRYQAQAATAPELLGDSEIDMVIVSTPNCFLSEYAGQAIKAGKHVLLEKPGAISSRQMEWLTTLHANSSNAIAKIGYNHRFHPAAQKIKSCLDVQAPILWIRAAYGHGGRPGYEGEWRFRHELSGGGEIIDQGVHLLDLIHWWTGAEFELNHASRQSAFYPSSEEDNGFLVLRTPTGCTAQIHCSATQWKNLFRIEIATSEALLVWDGLGNSNYGDERLTRYTKDHRGGKPAEEVLLFERSDSSWEAEWRHFYLCARAGKQPMSCLEDSKWILGIVEKAHSVTLSNSRSFYVGTTAVQN